VATLAPDLNPRPPPDLHNLAARAGDLAETFVALSCDIALVLDAGGNILRLVQHDAAPLVAAAWLGIDWTSTADADSRGKLAQLVADVRAVGHAERREINHADGRGGHLPIAWSAIRLGHDGPTLAVGHDLRHAAVLQQRFVAAQEALERSYWHAQQHGQVEALAHTLAAGRRGRTRRRKPDESA
jgi:hypothetical protein